MTTEDILNEENNEEVNNQTEGDTEVDENTEVNSSSGYNVGDKVSGTVYKVEDKFIRAHLDGSEYEGIVPISQLTNQRIEHPNEVVSEDDTIEGVVIKVEEEEGRHNVILSVRKLEETKSYDTLEEAAKNDETITGTVMDVVQAGLVVDVGVRGFIPASLLSDEYVEDLEQFAGQTVQVKVEDIDKEKNRVILNRKRIIEEDKKQDRKKQLSNLEKGSVIDGEVVRITNFGAFINLGDVDGLAHISELSYTRVEKVEDAVNIGDKVKVKVLDVNPENERVSLSVKQAGTSPFDDFAKENSVGDTLEGTVKRLVDFGAFVEVAPGVEGLVHVSEISHDHVAVPSDVLKVEESVQVKILSINEDSEKISLSIKETTERQPESKDEPKVYNDETEDDRPTLGDVFGDRFKNLDL